MRKANNLVRLPCPDDARIGQAARDWENDVNDVFDHCDIAAEIVDGNLRHNGDITLDEHQVRRILFCVYQAQRCAAHFKAAYYAAIDGT